MSTGTLSCWVFCGLPHRSHCCFSSSILLTIYVNPVAKLGEGKWCGHLQ